MKGRNTFLTMFMMLLIALASCSREEDSGMPGLLRGSLGIGLYHDVAYMIDGSTIKAISLTDELLEPVFMCSDSLCTHDNKSCPLFFGGTLSSMIIETAESRENE